LGEVSQAEASLYKALALDPDNGAAHFNMGLLKAEQKNFRKAETHLRAALEAEPQMAEAAYNLGLLIIKDHRDEAMRLIDRAYDLRPIPKYGYTLAFYAREQGNAQEAAKILRSLVAQRPTYPDAFMLLGDIYEKEGRAEAAAELYREALSREDLPRQSRRLLEMKLKGLLSNDKEK